MHVLTCLYPGQPSWNLISLVGIWFPLRQATRSVSGTITGWMSPERSLILLEHLLNDLLCVATGSLNSEGSVDVVSQGNTTLRVA